MFLCNFLINAIKKLIFTLDIFEYVNQMDNLVLSVAICIMFICIIGIIIIMLTCLDAANLQHSNEGLCELFSILDQCFIEFIDCICCIRRRDRVMPNIHMIDAPRRVPPPALVIVNPLDNITLGLECMSPDPETKIEPPDMD